MDIENLLSFITENILTKKKKLKDLILDIEKKEISNYNKYINFSDNTYKRNLVARNKYIEIFVMCWKTGQGSKFHKHPDNGCIMMILDGELTEEFKNNKNTIIRNYKKNDCNYIDNNMGIHRVFNNSYQDTISLHIYSPPNFYT